MLRWMKQVLQTFPQQQLESTEVLPSMSQLGKITLILMLIWTCQRGAEPSGMQVLLLDTTRRFQQLMSSLRRTCSLGLSCPQWLCIHLLQGLHSWYNRTCGVLLAWWWLFRPDMGTPHKATERQVPHCAGVELIDMLNKSDHPVSEHLLGSIYPSLGQALVCAGAGLLHWISEGMAKQSQMWMLICLPTLL